MIYRLNTTFHEKNEAKALGARWNPVEKYWYYETDGALPEGLKKWYDGSVQAAPKQAAPAQSQNSGSGTVSVTAGYANTMSVTVAAAGTATGASASVDQSGTAYAVITESELDQYKTVTEVNNLIQNSLQSNPTLQNILVKGEITNFTGHRKGQHYYFTIKDTAGELLNCFMYENIGDSLIAGGLQMTNGEQVAISGCVDYYGKNAKLSLRVWKMIDIGAGAMNLALLKLKEKLQAEGLFDDEYKKPIPKHPKNVGIVTSKSGMAIGDLVKVAGRRDPYVQLILYHVSVQGKDAVKTIVKGIETLDKMGLDSIIVGRGGGTLEELMCYNSELIARTVFAAKTPIISAVGHEGHWTLIDLVADDRAATPSEAAEKAVPDVMRDVRRVREQDRLLLLNMRHCIERRQSALKALYATLEKNSPENVLNNRMNRLKNASDLLTRQIQQLFADKKSRYDRIAEGLKDGMQELFDSRVRRLDIVTVKLNGLSPSSKLVKGFGYISHDGKPVSGVDDIQEGDDVQIRIHDGIIATRVTGVEKTTQADKGEENG